MKWIIVIFVVLILLSGCVDVNGSSLEFGVIRDGYDVGFVDGCMSALMMGTLPQDLPPYPVAYNWCLEVQETQRGFTIPLAPPPSTEIDAPIDCSAGQCI